MFLVQQRTRLKNRIQGALARYNIQLGARDVFSGEGRQDLGERQEEVPQHTLQSVELEQRALTGLEWSTGLAAAAGSSPVCSERPMFAEPIACTRFAPSNP